MLSWMVTSNMSNVVFFTQFGLCDSKYQDCCLLFSVYIIAMWTFSSSISCFVQTIKHFEISMAKSLKVFSIAVQKHPSDGHIEPAACVQCDF